MKHDDFDPEFDEPREPLGQDGLIVWGIGILLCIHFWIMVADWFGG